VKTIDTTDDTETELLQGPDFSVSGGNPGTDVVLVTAPDSNTEVVVYRVTPKVQLYDYLETGAFKANDHEAALDKIVMMVQEIDAGAISSMIPSNAAMNMAAAQAVAASGTVTLPTSDYQRVCKKVKGASGAQTADSTTPIEAGSIDGQELKLVGYHDTETLTILNSGNVRLGGDITLKKYTTLDLYWDDTDAVWVETSRKD
jgi:hypothetical protein